MWQSIPRHWRLNTILYPHQMLVRLKDKTHFSPIPVILKVKKKKMQCHPFFDTLINDRESRSWFSLRLQTWKSRRGKWTLNLKETKKHLFLIWRTRRAEDLASCLLWFTMQPLAPLQVITPDRGIKCGHGEVQIIIFLFHWNHFKDFLDLWDWQVLWT